MLLKHHCEATGRLLRWLATVNAALVDAEEEERLASSSRITGPVLREASAQKELEARRQRFPFGPNTRHRGRHLQRDGGEYSTPSSSSSSLSSSSSSPSSHVGHRPRSPTGTPLPLHAHGGGSGISPGLGAPLTTFFERLRLAAAAGFVALPVEWWGGGNGGSGGGGGGGGTGGQYFHYLARHRQDLHAAHARNRKLREDKAIAAKRAAVAVCASAQRVVVAASGHGGEDGAVCRSG